MSTTSRPILGGTFPHDPARLGDQRACRSEERRHSPGCRCSPCLFSPWLARARNARLLTEHL